MADRVDCARLVFIGSWFSSIVNLGLLIVPTFAGALVVRLLVGFGLALVYPPGVKLLSTWFPKEKRGGAIGVMFGFFCLGSAFPQLLRSADIPWRFTVVCTSALSAGTSAVVLATVRTGPFPFASSKFDPFQCIAVFRNVQVSCTIFAYCCHQAELFSMWAWMARFLQTAWGLS